MRKQEELKVRKLNTMDLMKCVGIVGKISFKAKDSFNVGNGEELNSMQIGMAFFSSAMQYAETDFKELLASIAEMTVEEFEKMPFDYPLELIEKLAEAEDLQGFLQRVIKLTKKLFQKS